MSYLRSPFSKSISVQYLFSLLGIWVLCLAPLVSHAQDDLNIHGVVSDALSASRLDGVTVTVTKNGVNHDSFTTRANGKYEFYLDCDSRYELSFVKDGYVERSIIIDAKNVPAEVIGAGIIMPTDMSMYAISEAMAEADLTVFQKPIGKAKYDPVEGDLVWDFGYTNKIKEEIMSLMNEVDKKAKELEKEQSAEAKAEEAREAEFNQFVEDGDEAMSKNQYQDAVLNYKAALKIKPDNLPVKGKLGSAEAKWTAQKAAAEKEANYAAALDAGDGFMRTEEFEKAIAQYQTALELKPDEEYPSAQITMAQQIVKDREANMAKQEQFNALMAEADKAFDEKAYSDALAKFLEAQKVIPDNQEVAGKIEDTQAAIANKEEMAKLQADYDALIAAADTKFAADDFQGAMLDYEAALELLPEETYPSKQIAVCNTKISEKAVRADKQASFDEYMTAGSAALAGSDYATAVEKYTGALGVFPDDATAKSKLEEAQSLFDEKNAAAEKQAGYEALIAEADDLYQADKLNEAKTKYQEAHALIAAETYPMSQITKIEAKLKQRAKKEAAQETYDAAMAAGAAAEATQKYSEAIEQYENALAVFAEDEAALEALDNARKLKTEFDKNQAADEEYNALLTSADSKFGTEQYEEARADYQAALQIKPDQEYPTTQLALIETAIAERAAEAAAAEKAAQIQAEYEGFMTAGNTALAASKFEEAIGQYENALNLKAGDPAATEKRDEAQAQWAALKGQQAIDEQYNLKIAEADKLFADHALKDAKMAYQAAGKLKVNEPYPKDQIALIDEQITAEKAAAAEAEMQAKTEQVNALALEGDNLVKAKAFSEGIAKYEEALALLPERDDVKKKRDEATAAMLAYQIAQGTAEAYKAAIDKADKAYKNQEWETAKAAYQNALTIKSDEQYPKDQIADIEVKIAASQAAALKAEQEALQAQFNGLIKDGNKKFKREQYEAALIDYESARALLPENELAIEKIESVNKILGKLSAQADVQQQYETLVAAGDALFEEESYEMARLKFLDAQELMPDEAYPPKKITAIDIQLEKKRLAAERAATDKLNEEYSTAVRQGDELLRNEEYDEAIDSYTIALELKPDEVYPKSQIERIELLKEEKAATAAAEMAKSAQQEKNETNAHQRRAEVTSNVNTNSEEQAEQFMRDAREAQKQEKYDRIKEKKARNAQNKQNYQAEARARRESNFEHIESYKSGVENQRTENIAEHKEQIRNSVTYKEALIRNRQIEAKTAAIQRRDRYAAIQEMKENRTERVLNWQDLHGEKVLVEVEQKEAIMEQMKEWSQAGAAHRRKVSKKFRENALQRYTENKVADALREQRTEEFMQRKQTIADIKATRMQDDLERVREAAEKFDALREQYSSARADNADDRSTAAIEQIERQSALYQTAMEGAKIQAEIRRAENLKKANRIQTGGPKDFDDYFRTELSENYPQGVSEESSTLGNKVIITRIVVKGNRGDRYKKVLDKAGNYYFKNGRSISEATWNRETIEAFNNSKD